jgi:hypothetical protein
VTEIGRYRDRPGYLAENRPLAALDAIAGQIVGIKRLLASGGRGLAGRPDSSSSCAV